MSDTSPILLPGHSSSAQSTPMPISDDNVTPTQHNTPPSSSTPPYSQSSTSKNSVFSKFSPPKKSPLFLFLIAQILIVATIAGAYFGYQKFFVKSDTTSTTSEEKEGDEKSQILAHLSSFVDLPSDEPVIMTVTDKEKLTNNPFFKKVENDDKVLVFKNSSRALIYRPSTKKLIDMQTVALDEGATNDTKEADAKVAGASTENTSVKVAILNGTSTAGLATKSKERLLKSVKEGEVDVTFLGNATNRSYTQGIVFDSTGKLSQASAQLEKLFGVKTVKTLPAGETLPAGAQILIIVTQ